MDIWTWPAWAVGALFGGVGGAIGSILGSILEMLTKKKGVRDIATVVCTVIAIAVSTWQVHEHKADPDLEPVGATSSAQNNSE